MLRLTADIRCMNCSYLLHGLDSNRCPECGHPFDRKNPETYADYILDGKHYLLMACLGPFFMALPFVAWFAVDWLAGRLDAFAYFQSEFVLSTKIVTGLVLVSLGWLTSGSVYRSGRSAIKNRKVYIEGRKYVRLGILVALISFCSLILYFLFLIVMMVLVAIYS